MGFPIALGTKSVASRPIPAAQPLEEFDYKNGGLLLPSLPSAPLIVVATSADQELLASITLYYYNMHRKDDGRVAFSVAELHIQISLLAQSTSLSGREMLHRIPLPCSPVRGDPDEKEEDHSTHYQSAKVMAIFSSDRRYLTCLIPHPCSSGCAASSSVIVFQLRRPKGMDSSGASHARDGPPLPAYVAPTLLERPIVPVATNPTILLSSASTYPDEERPLIHATSVCDVEASVGPLVSGLLLVGCQDGSVQVATYRPAVCCGVLHPATGDETSTPAPIVELDHWTEWRDLNEKTMVGRLAVVSRDGRVKVFRSHFAETDDTDPTDCDSSTTDRLLSSSIRSTSSTATRDASDFSFGVIPTHEFPNHDDDDEFGWNSGPTKIIVCVKWISASYLAVLEAPDVHCTIHVMGLYDYGKYASLSTMTITKEQLDESEVSIFRNNSDPCSTHPATDFQRTLLLEYDAYTNCLAISSFLEESDNNAWKRRFLCLWNWRMNVLGLMASLTPDSANDALYCGTLHFSIDHVKRRKIVRIGSSATTPTQHQLYKETYDIATLSPPYETAGQRCKLRESNALLLSSESVSFPYCTKTSPATEHFEIEWMETAIPVQYLSSFGAPSLAAMGKELGRSIAIASARGFCVLDRACSDRPIARVLDDEASVKLSRAPRWRLFANETHEKAFRVVAMTWWEGFLGQKSGLADTHAHTDDFLVAIIEVLESHDKSQGYYLSCWSGRDVELSAQLLRAGNATNGIQKGTCWGIPLPRSFLPGCIDLLACPFIVHGRRCATVLLADSTYSTNYYVHQLQVVSAGPQANGSNHFGVQCQCIAFGNIGSPSELFLASASFSLTSRDVDVEKPVDFAVLGVIRKYGGGLDAVSVCSSNIVSVGQVVESADRGDDEPRSSEISRYWLADVVLDQKHLFVWSLQLACGRLVSWMIPFLESMDALNVSSYLAGLTHRNAAASLVHLKSSVLGFVCPSGTISNWMQQSSAGAQRDFLCGNIPRSSKGCVLGVSQGIKSLRTSLPLDSNERHLPSTTLDHAILCPNDFKLYPPAFLPSLYVLAFETDSMSISPSYGSERFERHLQEKMKSVALQDVSVMSIQLIILRLVEKLAVIGKTSESTSTQKYAHLRRILITVVTGIRYQTTALQFAFFFLQLGRHVEPSCLPHLFPLPETVEDLLFISASSGSIHTAVSAIPLLSDQRSSFSLCTSLFHYCLNHFDTSFGAADTSYEFAINTEELEATGGLFRYALKGQPRRTEVHHDHAEDDVTNDDDVAPSSRYSIMCGLSNIFGGGRSKPALQVSVTELMDDSPLLVHRITEERINTLKEYGLGYIRRLSLWKELHPSNQFLGSVPALASRYVVATLFGGSALDSSVGWIKVAALASVLMQDVAPPERCGSSLTYVMRQTKVNRWVSLVPVDIRRGGMTHVLEYCLQQCRLDAEQSGRVLDFLLVLLQRCDPRHLGSDRPGLLLAAVAAAHVAERISDVLDPTNTRMDELSAAYFELFHTSFDSSTNDDTILIV